MEAIAAKINGAPAIDNSAKWLDKLLSERVRKLQRIRSVYDSLYSDWKLGEISYDEYKRMRAQYMAEMDLVENAILTVKEEQKHAEDGVSTENSLFIEFWDYKNIQKLGCPALVSLVDVIYVHGNKEITIKFLFKDELLRVVEHIEQNGNGENPV